MNKYAIYGAGDYGNRVTEYLCSEDIAFYIDMNEEKQSTGYMGYKVYPLEKAVTMLGNKQVVIALSAEKVAQVRKMLEKEGVTAVISFQEIQMKYTKEKILSRTDYIEVYKRAINWVKEHSLPHGGIICTTGLPKSYPEVTGYYIPTLLRWGYKELALEYTKYLCSIQHESGAWYDTENVEPYIFDSAQILKGLLAIRMYYPAADEHIIKGCDWILSNMTEEGRLVAPNPNIWGDGKIFSELIHTYCISPIGEAGKIFKRADYVEKAQKIAEYYTVECKEQILHFDLLSHFYAYVMEAMLDIGHEELAREAMDKIGQIQRESGVVPAYNNVAWTCSTGLFQLAVVWYRLGELDKGNRAFNYACKLQNKTGGWYGSYLSEDNPYEVNNYFPQHEISWAVKYFLDALYYKNQAQFENQASLFGSEINTDDGRYQCIEGVVKNTHTGGRILDVGCGKGRYLNQLSKRIPDRKYYAVDISLPVMEYFSLTNVKKMQGTLTNIPYADNYFDAVYTCEALEHAVDIPSAMKELCRVTQKGGQVAIVDKNKEMLGYFEIEEWEQWFDENELRTELLKYCSDVKIIKDINFDNQPANGLFCCWIGTVD